MVTTHPTTSILATDLGRPTVRVPPAATPRPVAAPGSWRYSAPNHTRRIYFLAALISASCHALVFFGTGRHHQVIRAMDVEKPNVIRIAMPDLKDLEEPEPVVTDEPPPPAEALYAPTLMDVPNRIALPTDFVQKIDFASLIPPPDMNSAKVFVIPSHILRGVTGQGMANIFNLADLDRIPEPVVQPAPVFPRSLRREVFSAKVVVEFIVDTEGRVHTPVVVETTHDGFNDAAMAGVSRWRFRAGMKGGRKVNTRMSVPILFKLVSADDN
jgi:protein TonB